jgi:predicted DCC family thiol-disulfide oxidoreductase YuxK
MNSFHPGRNAFVQRAIMALLEDSPLPWTAEMLDLWFERRVSDCLYKMARKRRVWRCARGLYTSINRYECQVVMVTDEMIERYTGMQL